MPAPEAHEVIEGYLAQVSTTLAWAGRRAVTDIVDELRDGLWEATEAETARGTPDRVAALAALDRFGSPALVAGAHAGELALRRARCAAWTVVGVLVCAAVLWRVGYAHALGVPASVVPPGGVGQTVFLAATIGVQVLPPLAVAAALLHLAVTRRPDVPARLARTGAGLCAAALLGLLVTMTGLLLTGGPELWTSHRTAVTALLLAGQGAAFTASIALVRRTLHTR